MGKNFLSKILLLGALAAACYLFVRFLLPITLPFLGALGITLAAEGAVRWLSGRLGLPRSLAGAIGVTAVILLGSTVVVLGAAGLMRQLPRLGAWLPELEQAVLTGRQALEDFLRGLAGRLPGSVGQLMQQWVGQLFSGESPLLSPVLEAVPRMVTGAIGKMSQGLFGLLTALIASYLLSARLPQLRQYLSRLLPQSMKERIRVTGQGLRQALGGWLLAQLKLAAITFLILSAGFFLLRIQNSLLWSFLVTLVDAFPVLGVGTVLLPWSLVCVLQGDIPRALGLLGIYIAAWLVRQVAEPKLVGKGLGLDPLITLLAIYGGFRLGGILGMLIAPILGAVAVQALAAFRPREDCPPGESPISS